MKKTGRLKLTQVISYLIFSLDKAMLFSTLLNSALAYMSVFHFDEASKCIDFILNEVYEDSEIFFRKA